MKLDPNCVRRLALYFFTDLRGRADEVNVSMIKGLKEAGCHVMTVVSGYADRDSVRKLAAASDEMYGRPNLGTLRSALGDVFMHLGVASLSAYEEIVVVQSTMIGPFYPLLAYLNSVCDRDIDVWSLYGSEDAAHSAFDTGFFVMRKPFFTDRRFVRYLTESVVNENFRGVMETQMGDLFTTKFAEKHPWGVMCDFSDMRDLNDDVLLYLAPELVASREIPCVPRRLFTASYDTLIKNSCAETPARLLEVIREKTDYNASDIMRSLLVSENLADMERVLHTSYFLPEDATNRCSSDPREFVVIVCADKAYYDRLTLPYRKPLSKKHPFYFLDGEMSYAEKLNKAAEIAAPYRYACILGFDDYEIFDEPRSNDLSLIYRDFMCCLPSEEYAANVCDLFEQYPEIGMLVPPVPNFGNFFTRMQDGWNGHLEALRQCMNALGAETMVIAQKTHPLFPAGGSLWIRSGLLMQIADVHLENLVFADGKTGFSESIEKDALTRLILPYLLQKEQYLTAAIYSNAYASIELTNLDFTFRKNNEAIFKRWMSDYYENEIRRIRGTFS